MLVLKGNFGGSLKMTSENKIIFKAKNTLKRFLGFPSSGVDLASIRHRFDIDSTSIS